MPNEAKFMSAMNKPTVHAEVEKKMSQNEGSLFSRVEGKMDLFREQFNNAADDEPILTKATELLQTYGTYKNVPTEELDFDKSGFDDARLLAFVKLLEDSK